MAVSATPPPDAPTLATLRIAVQRCGGRPVLLAVSDNGAQMPSGSTREFMALHAIATHFGRPGVPTDQAPIESFLGHIKTESPQLAAIAPIKQHRTGRVDDCRVMIGLANIQTDPRPDLVHQLPRSHR